MKDKKKACVTELVVLIMGWANLLFFFLALILKFGLLLYFMSAGWIIALKSFIGLFLGNGLSSLSTLDSKQIIITSLGTIYGLYHIILILFFLFAARKISKRITYFFGVFSIIILFCYTVMGFNFTWT
ncbi:MAG: hypothetical protein KJ915_00790 [Candidatus Omnitrophica bacterium]|nr:hypothetical protein [Candidatus Omnitrophota bacterium]